MTQTFIKKPITVTAFQWNGPEDNNKCKSIFKVPPYTMVLDYNMEASSCPLPQYSLRTLEGHLMLTPGCWIVGPGYKKEFWVVDQEVFEATYVSDKQHISAEDKIKKIEKIIAKWEIGKSDPAPTLNLLLKILYPDEKHVVYTD